MLFRMLLTCGEGDSMGIKSEFGNSILYCGIIGENFPEESMWLFQHPKQEQ